MLLAGNLAANVLGIASLMLTARALSVSNFGTLVMVTTWVAVVDQMFNFQSWQAVVKFGADAIEASDYEKLKLVLRKALILDVATAVFGYLVLCFTCFCASFFGVSREVVYFAAIFGVTILFNLSGIPFGILRLYKRFSLISVATFSAALVRLAFVALAFQQGWGLLGFVFAWTVGSITGSVLLWCLSFSLLREEALVDFLQTPKPFNLKIDGFTSFTVSTNLSGSLKMGAREADVLVVGAVLGSAGAGLYKIAKQVGSAFLKLVDPLYQAIYPQLAEQVARGQYRAFASLSIISGVVALLSGAVIFLLVFAFSSTLITLVAGEDFLNAAPVLVMYMVSVVIAAAGFPLQPGMLALGFPRQSLVVHAWCTFIYLPLLILFAIWWGLVGAALAYAIYYALWTVVMMELQRRIIKRLDRV